MSAQKPRSGYRQLQAQMTKDRIVAAARKLMAERGWTGATIDAIADEAGVATPTVYAAFKNKRSIVEAMRDTMLRDAEIPELMQRAAAEPDAATRLQLWAKLVRQQMQTSYDVISIHRQAARADPEFATEYRRVLDNRARAFAEFIEGLQDALAPGIDTRTATDLLWALSTEELFRELVDERGWSPGRFEQWLARTLVAQLLDEPAASCAQPTATSTIHR
ncbi:MAG: TetR/AcrR family transcriptional regulator [Actinobacteria bacterium]|nr:TetR/AcrR family transcriptional regulator [Actinomycetota bacterium]